MKNRIVVFYGYIGLVGVSYIIVYLIYDLISLSFPIDMETLGLLLGLFLSLSNLLYLIHTRFWSRKSNELKTIENENEIMKMKIEKAELEEKLNKLYE